MSEHSIRTEIETLKAQLHEAESALIECGRHGYDRDTEARLRNDADRLFDQLESVMNEA